jgi:hypothetical protein
MPTFESARAPATAIPYMFREEMGIADPEHAHLSLAQQHEGPLPGKLNDNKPQLPTEGVQNPAAGKGMLSHDPIAVASMHFSVGVLTRMVLEAARGNKIYAHGGKIPAELTQAMEAFVRKEVAFMRSRKSPGEQRPDDHLATQATLRLHLIAFFKSR